MKGLAFVIFATLLANMHLLSDLLLVPGMSVEVLLVLKFLVAQLADVSGFIRRVFCMDVASKRSLALKLSFAWAARILWSHASGVVVQKVFAIEILLTCRAFGR